MNLRETAKQILDEGFMDTQRAVRAGINAGGAFATMKRAIEMLSKMDLGAGQMSETIADIIINSLDSSVKANIIDSKTKMDIVKLLKKKL
jgi:hypothetical protein